MAFQRRSTYGLEAPRGADWRDQALCRENPDVWFDPTLRAAALHICLTHCPVLDQCRDEALAAPPQEAVQGGMAFNQKRRPLPDYWHAPARTCPRCTELPPRAPATDTGVCGSYPGYRRHLRRSEEACEPCKTAAARRAREDRKRAVGARKQQKEAGEA